MNPAEIEFLISQAITNRPRVTTAPMNLYVHQGRLVCGARIVMPTDALFISHLSPHHITEGFNNQEWKVVVDKISQVARLEKPLSPTRSALSTISRESFSSTAAAKPDERRRERRLLYRTDMWFAENQKKNFLQGRMLDISSGGIAFSCNDEYYASSPGETMNTRFSIPRLNPDKSFDTVSFTRRGRVCRLNKLDTELCKIALQFAKPLPFKPAEQNSSESSIEQCLQTIS